MKKRILIVAERGMEQLGGIPKVIKSFSAALKNDFDFDLLVFMNKADEYKKQNEHFKNIYFCDCGYEKKDSQSKLLKLWENLTRPFRVYNLAKKIIKKNKYDVVHTHDLNKGAWCLRAAKKYGVGTRISQMHNPDTTDPKNAVNRLYIRLSKKIMFDCANVFTGCSVGACKIFEDAGKPYTVINNELDLSLYNPENFERKAEDGKIHFVHVGRFTFQKNHEFLINTYSEIHKALPETDLTLIGWGEKEEEIKKQIASLGLTDNVTVLPGNSDVPYQFSRSDYMIFPSRYEGFGRVLIEAQAMNVMCFASDVIPQETALGRCVYYSLDAGPSVWAKNITDFIKSDEIKNHTVDKEKLAAFDLAEVVKQYKAVYESKTKTGI